MEKYEPLGVVGEGSYGVVLKCKCRDNGKTVAIKKFIDSEDDQNVRKIALREIRVLRKLRHENLVNLIEVFRRRKHIYLVFEFIDHTLLDELEQKSQGLDEETCRKYIYQILRGLNFCHENNIIHRDVKPENVLVSKNGIVKLCDFGFARNMTGPGEVFTDYVATRWYRAPELLVGDIAYGKEVDVWALGCLFSEMMTGEPLFPGDSDIDQLFLIAQCLGRLSKRHLNIMQRNSAFRGFQFPDSTHSRHGSTASTASTKMSKMIAERKSIAGSSNKSSALSTAAHDGSATGNERNFSGGSITKSNNGSSGSIRKKRLVSVERSVFSRMFPSWPDETVQFLTLCLDPEPTGRPSCNSLMRLKYFTHDNFPPRFIPELNAKLQLEGRAPISSFSTKKKRFVSNNSVSSGNVSSSVSPTSRSSFNLPNSKNKNPLYQTRGNLSQIDDEPLSLTNTLTHPPPSDTTKLTPSLSSSSISQKVSLQSNNLINFQNSNANSNLFSNSGQNASFPTQQPSQPLKFMNRDRDPPPSYSLLFDKPQKEKFLTEPAPRKPSFSMNAEPSLANASDNSKIPVLLSRKYSDDSIISSNSNLSSGGSPQTVNTSKSTSNIPEETGLGSTLPSASTLSNFSSYHHQHHPTTKEKRLSIQISTPLIIQNQAYNPNPPSQPPSNPKKYSFSFPATTLVATSTTTSGVAGTQRSENNNEGEDTKLPSNSTLSKQLSTQLPVTTLTFSMNTTGGVSFSQSLVKSPGNIAGSTGATGTSGSVGNQTFSMYQKRSSPTTITKPTKSFSVNNSSYFPQPNGYSGGGGGNGGNTSLASSFSTQNTFTYQNSLGNSKSLPVTIVGSSMLRNSNHANSNLGTVAESSFLPRMTGKSTGLGNNNKGNNDENVASLLSNTGSPPKHGTSALMRKREKWDQQTQQNGRKFSVFNANYEGN